MTTYVINKAGLKLFEQHLKRYEPAHPLYETYTDDNGRQKRRKRETPPGLSKRDARILKSVKKRAHRLDAGLNICGFRVGLTFFVGVIPGAGDALNAVLGYWLIVRKAQQADIPPWLYYRMVGNQAIATIIGFVPVIGDIGIAVFKTNSRNAALLEEYLRIRGEEFLKVQADRVEDPEVVKPGAGKEEADEIPGKAPSQSRFGFFRRSSKKVPTGDAPAGGKDETKPEGPKSSGRGDPKGKGKEKSQ
ncbi:hypothetical protein BDM02DRAFT_3116385 [Thelephora ganbajun]|uniref:Uncharacterized protein n=1 Tax=Thelephora ganbajun TaxID=370292 RepID=A0ACB6ZE64_THEGA|nr:hypothetical protein BDM02DRAFT_3116385 [Thelephora ganbajun]